jgi:hypothetical protein
VRPLSDRSFEIVFGARRFRAAQMKDYFDLWLLSRQPELNKVTLRTAIERTFKNRNMEIDKAPIGLSSGFGNDLTKQIQWTAFLKRSNLTEVPSRLADVVQHLRAFFETIL